MRITIEAYGDTFTWETKEDGKSLAELVPQLKGLLVATGFHPKSVDECFNPDAFEWFPDYTELRDPDIVSPEELKKIKIRKQELDND